ncbi:hypothetical protein ACU17_08615 [Xanthomonas oryzae pv. oryzicola]|nr:hypothetical protein ACU17_08615 [Xanthomonas oryzae pv. oryzicola]
MRVDSGVDCFVAHALTWIIRMHGLELGSNLLGRPTIQNQVVTHLLKERRRPEVAYCHAYSEDM